MINEIVDTALAHLELAGNTCGPLNCVCQGAYEGCPMRAADYSESEDDSDMDVNVSSDEGIDF